MQNIGCYFCGRVIIAEYEALFMVHFSELLTACGWEGDTRLRLYMAICLGGAMKKSRCLTFNRGSYIAQSNLCFAIVKDGSERPILPQLSPKC